MAAAGPAPVDRRTFLRRSGLAAGGLAAAGAFQLGTVQKAAAISPPQPGVPVEIKKSI
jgi:formate dehydrogenase major subunit